MSETIDPPLALPPASHRPAKDKNRTLLVIAAVASAATLAIILLVAYHYLRTFTIHGTATTSGYASTRDTCTNYGRFHPRAAVIVYDAAGAIVGTSQLDEGTPVGGYRCEYTFTVTGVRDGSPYYQMQVDDSNKVMYSRDEIENVALEPRF